MPRHRPRRAVTECTKNKKKKKRRKDEKKQSSWKYENISRKLRFRNPAGNCYWSRAELFVRSPNWSKRRSGNRRRHLWESCVNRPFIYITHRRNVDNWEIDITVVPARDVARCPLYRAFAYKHTPTNNTAVHARSLHSNALTPRGLNRRDTPTSPDSRSVFAFTDVPAVCIPSARLGESCRGKERCGGMCQRECTTTSFFGILPFSSFSKLCICIYIYAPLLRARAISKDFYSRKSR